MARWRKFIVAGLRSLCTASDGCAQGTLSEYRVKTAYLLDFLKFARRPVDAFGDPPSPIDGAQGREQQIVTRVIGGIYGRSRQRSLGR
jgi:hypothetical protein